jgi:hypothetical protein
MNKRFISSLMLRTIIALQLCLIHVLVNAQSGHASKKDAAIIKSTELLVITDDSASAYNDVVKNTIETYWRFSTFMFITQSEKKNYCTEGYTMLDRKRIDNYSSQTYYMAIVFPGRNGCKWNNADMKAYSYVSTNPAKLKGEMIRSIQFIQNYLNFVLLEGGGDNALKLVCSSCNKESKAIKEKLLLMNNGDLQNEIDDSSKIARYYKHPFKLVGREDICRAIEEQKSDVAYFLYFKDEKGYVFRLAVQSKDSKILYCERDYSDRKQLFDKVNLKELSR